MTTDPASPVPEDQPLEAKPNEGSHVEDRPVGEGRATEQPAQAGDSAATDSAATDSATTDSATKESATEDSHAKRKASAETEPASPDAPAADDGAPATGAAPVIETASAPADADTTADAAPADDAASTSGEGDDNGEATGGQPAAKKKKAKKKKARKKPAHRRPPMRAPEPPPLPPELKDEATAATIAHVLRESRGGVEFARTALEALRSGTSLSFLGRFRRKLTGGMDERRLRSLRDRFEELRILEERRVGIRTLLNKRGALTDEASKKLAAAERTGEMEDLAAPYLPVTASRATVARGHGLEPLADAIRNATEEGALSELAKPLLPDDAEPTAIDQALAGARDILAEELCLDPALRGALRNLFWNKGVLTVGLRSERKGDPGRHANLVGFSHKALKVPAMKVLAIRRAEKERVVVTSIEPPEERALEIVHRHAAPEGHPHAGFLKAAAEDGYRRILKPLLQNELRTEVKHGADTLALEIFERNLRNLLLGPYAGARRTLGLRPDVMNGHRWCAVDEGGDPVGSGTLPHAPTAGREACVEELQQVLKTYEVSAIAIGTTGGRADAVSVAKEAIAGRDDLPVVEVADGGTRALEGMGPLEMDERPTVPAECRGALSLARRFQDPLAELVQIDPKALNLGPGVHDVHQGRLRTMLDDSIRSCVAHVGVDPNRASVQLLAWTPGFNRKAAEALVAWRDTGGRIERKGQLAAVDGVGPKVAEQAVGFMRVAGAEDPRERSQLHPEQFGLIDRIVEQVESDVAALFAEPKLRAQTNLDALKDAETDIHALRYALFQATAGMQDPRPVFTAMIPPPDMIKFDTVTPGLILQAKVLRAAPFGVFVDVGLGTDALIPTPHLGERPGLEQAAVAPVGAVVTTQVLELDAKKKKLTLSMRRDADPRAGGPRSGGPRGRGRAQGGRPQGPPRQGGRGPREGGERREHAGAGARGQGGRGQGQGSRGQGQGSRGQGQGSRGQGQGSRGQGQGSRGQGQGGRGPGGRSQGGRGKGSARKGGKFGGGQGFSIFDKRGGGGRRDAGTPRKISLKADDPKAHDAEVVDESKLTPEELMQRKLDEMKRKLQGG